MNRRGAILSQGLDVCGGSVAFVGSKAVFRKHLVIFHHQAVPCHFGNNTCGGNGYALCISLDNRYLADFHSRYGNRVIQENVRLGCQSGYGLPHGLIRGLQNIDLVNFLRRHKAKTCGNGLFHNHFKQLLSLFFGELLGIIYI